MRTRLHLPLLPNNRDEAEADHWPEASEASLHLAPSIRVEDAQPALRDAVGRAIRYVRLSVTDRCNFACVYCMPEGGEGLLIPRNEILQPHDYAVLAKVLAELGATKIRFTGGEPMVRKDILDLVAAVHQAAPQMALALSSNGTLLDTLGEKIFRAGVRAFNLSIDSMNEIRFREFTRGGELRTVLLATPRLKEIGARVRWNVVAMQSNRSEWEAIVQRAAEEHVEVRFIELMPFGEGSRLYEREFVACGEVKNALQIHLGARASLMRHDTSEPDAGPARYFERSQEGLPRIGFISASSEDFCDSCNRIRFGADGRMRTCLAYRAGTDFLAPLRAGDSEEVRRLLIEAVAGKFSGHRFGARELAERSDLAEAPDHLSVSMSRIGG